LVLMTGLAPCRLSAQTNSAKTTPSDRCLLIVDTSRTMKRRAAATLKIVQALIASGLNGQLRSGDTVGLWTFNETLQAGRFPLQTWSPKVRSDVAARALAFLKVQKYEKHASFDKVVPALAYVVRHSERITVILISGGEEKVRGTPFDERIAEFYEEWRDQQAKARMPFVTVLRGQNGQLVDLALNTPPWPLQIPKPPQDHPTAKRAETPPQEISQNAQTSAVPPLIVSSKKPRPLEAPAPKPAPPTAPRKAPALSTSAALGTNLASLTTTTPRPPANRTPQVQPGPVTPRVLPIQPSPKPTPPPPRLATPKAQAANAPPAKPVEPIAPAPKAETPVASVGTTQPAPATKGPSQPAAATELTPAPAIPPLPAAEAHPAPNAKTIAGSPRPAPPTSTNPPAQTGVATPAEGFAFRNPLWIVVPLVAVFAAVLVLIRLRRVRSMSHGSLITRSYERDNKP